MWRYSGESSLLDLVIFTLACVTWFVLANNHMEGIRSIFANRPYHSAAMLSLRRIKKLCSRMASLAQNSVWGLPCKNKAFYSSETQHDRQVIKVYGADNLSLDWPTVSFRNMVMLIFFFFSTVIHFLTQGSFHYYLAGKWKKLLGFIIYLFFFSAKCLWSFLLWWLLFCWCWLLMWHTGPSVMRVPRGDTVLRTSVDGTSVQSTRKLNKWLRKNTTVQQIHGE